MRYPDKPCEMCGTMMEVRHIGKRTCSDNCRQDLHRLRKRVKIKEATQPK